MIFVVLTIVAMILFANGMMILGKFGGKQMAWMNLFACITIAIMGIYIGFSDGLKAVGPTQSFAAAASCLVFAMAYLMVAAELFCGTDFKALGWFCFMGGCAMLLIGLGYFHVVGTALVPASQFGVFWLMWGALFWLFWACWGLGVTSLVPFTGYYTIFVAFFTSLYPSTAFYNMGRIGW